MSEKWSEVLEAYDMMVVSTYRGRGVLVCVTDKGLYLLKEFDGSVERLAKEELFKQQLYDLGYTRVDRYVRNREGELLSYDKYHTAYVMKEHFEGKECNMKNCEEMQLAVAELARFHQHGRALAIKQELVWERRVSDIYEKHNRELKRVKAHISGMRHKSEFEYLYITCFQDYYEKACRVSEGMKKLSGKYNCMGYCHGACNQHNLLVQGTKVTLVNYEKFCVDCQLLDLHQFVRKAMEKNEYRFDILQRILGAYHQVEPLSKGEYELLYTLLAYPEKFWKISNRYYNTRKSWIPPKTIEKLQTVLEQERVKEQLLQDMREYYGLEVIL